MTYNKKQQSYRKGTSRRRSSFLGSLLKVLLPFVLLVAAGVFVAMNLGWESFLFPQYKTELNEHIVEEIEKEVIVKTEKSNEKIYKQDDIIPYFPGCENIGKDIYDKWRCSIEKAKGFIYDNLEYPATYIGKGGGVVHIRFVVDKEGNVINPEIYQASNGFEDAVLKAFKKMPRWIPATNAGVPVNAERILLIHIDEKQYIISDKSEPLKSDDGYFIVPEKMAYFTKCEDVTDGEKHVCNKKYISHYVNPKIYGGMSISLYKNDTTKSDSYLKFIVNKEGNITNIRTKCGNEEGNELAKVRVKNIPQFIPAQHQGKSVNVEFVFPCRTGYAEY